MAEKDGDTARTAPTPLGAVLIIPVLAAGLTIYFLVSAAGLVWEARANGTVIGIILLALVAIQFAKVARAVASGRGSLGFGDLLAWSPLQAQRLALIAIVALFIVTMPWLGTTLGLFLAMAASMAVLGVRAPGKLVGFSLAVAATVYILFIHLLQSRLPVGLVEKGIDALLGRG